MGEVWIFERSIVIRTYIITPIFVPEIAPSSTLSMRSRARTPRICQRFPESLNPPVRLHVLSSETGNWSMHETPFGYSFRCTLLRRCIYVDGTLYCISTSKQLICFDLNRGNSRAIRLPQWKRLDPDGFGCAGSLRIVARTTAHGLSIHPMPGESDETFRLDGLQFEPAQLTLELMESSSLSQECVGFSPSFIKTSH
ncbi:hypothetical protein OIU74_021463 [Salix koriyanagi]|uniref:F-box protein n=1 Tax=Salix koriyanagi TaxID=2511006 RepID=A0A9Q0WJL6_9ROSI|nr:hypothetical protein OIU74_021463 [Salix koriyanagi]